MKLIRIRRRTKTETRYIKRKGVLTCKVIRIKKTLLGLIPFKKVQEYRETYNGEIEDTEVCDNENVLL